MRDISTNGNYKYVFNAYDEPIARVKPGETVTFFTEDAFEGAVKTEKDLPAKVRGPWVNPQVGPIYIEGTTPGDTLAIHILDIQPGRSYGWSCLGRNFGGLVANPNTPMLNPPLEERMWIYRYQDGMLVHDDRLTFRWEPFIGTIATAPAQEAIRSDYPFCQGGNMDVMDVKQGNILYLPVSVDGAYFFAGDCHAKQGNGEICGAAIEIAGRLTLRFEVIKQKTLRNPRIESPEELMCVGSEKPLEEAARIAYIELLDWMVELGWDRLEAYQCMSHEADMYVGNMVNPRYSMVAKIKKSIAYRAGKP
jgi:acetamidase/formamidase